MVKIVQRIPIEPATERNMNPQVAILFPALGWEVAPWISHVIGCRLSTATCCAVEGNIPEQQWRMTAALLIADYTGIDDIDSDLLDWIIRK